MKFLTLLGLLLLCAFFENLGDAGGYLAKSTRGQFALAIGAMAVYGALAVAISKTGWSFTHAFPIHYIFAYKLMAWAFAAYIDGTRITRWDILGGVLILSGLGVTAYGVLQTKQY
jgi:drug/metabolite transporter superfamily protein YnfA